MPAPPEPRDHCAPTRAPAKNWADVTSFTVMVADPARDADLIALAARLGAPVVEAAPAIGCVLTRDRDGLVLRAPVAGGRAEVRVEGTRARPGLSLRTSRLARAVGNERRGRVIDATAGLGRDAFELAALGYRVLLCERHPVLAFLLADALADRRSAVGPGSIRCKAGAMAGDVCRPPITPFDIELHQGDARPLLATLVPGTTQAVCLDPMFPPRSKSAQVKKEAQVLQLLVGEETDTHALFTAAWPIAPRIVVKRPLHAPSIADDVSFTVEGRAVRFDVYLTTGRSAPAFTRTPAP